MADYATRERIFEAIEQTIIELGIEAVTFAEIAARVHMQPSSLTYYFPQKDDMLAEFFSWWLTTSRGRPDERVLDVKSQTPEQAVRELCDWVDYMIVNAPFEHPVIRHCALEPCGGRARRPLLPPGGRDYAQWRSECAGCICPVFAVWHF